MRVTHLVRQYSPSVGGLEQHVASLAAAQKSLGYDVQVVTLNRLFRGSKDVLSESEMIDGINVRRVPFTGGQRYFLAQFSGVKFSEADLLHVHCVDNFFDHCGVTKRVHRKPLVCTTHGGFFHTRYLKPLKVAYFHSLTRFFAHSYDGFIACSEADGALFRKITNRVNVLPNAVRPVTTERCSGDDLLYLGRLSKNKCLERLLAFYARLNEKGDAGHLHIVGPEFDLSRAALIEHAQSLGIEDKVSVYGFLNDGELTRLFRRCGFFVSASAYEGFGMTMIECMAAGLLPIVHRNDSFEVLQREAGVGLLLDFADPHQAAERFANWRACLTADKRSNEQSRAQAYAEKFNWPSYARDVERVYLMALGPEGEADGRRRILAA